MTDEILGIIESIRIDLRMLEGRLARSEQGADFVADVRSLIERADTMPAKIHAITERP